MSMCLHFNFAWNYARISDNNTSFSLSSFLPKHKQQFRYAKMFPASFRAWPKPLPFVLQPQPNQNPASSSTLKWDEYNFWLFLLFYCWQSTEWLVYVRVCCLSMQYIAKVCLKKRWITHSDMTATEQKSLESHNKTYRVETGRRDTQCTTLHTACVCSCFFFPFHMFSFFFWQMTEQT